jgi:diguanylate cyclase (GGDEF)-like protein/PAS domain S-box-containing protein
MAPDDRPIPLVAHPLGPDEAPTADRYQWMVETVQEVIFEADPTGAWTYLNPAWERALGHGVEESLGRSFLEFVHPDDRQANLDIFMDTVSTGKRRCRFEARYLTATGGSRHMEIHAWIFRGEDGTPLGSTGTLTDVTDRHLAELELERRATHDPLTGLPNRTLLAQRLTEAIGAMGGGHLALLFLDIDRFKLVNDGVGHDTGDHVLRVVADRLRRAVPPDHLVARFGGDEFVIVAPGLAHQASRELAARIRASVAAPIHVDDRELTTTISVGIRVLDAVVASTTEAEVLAVDLLRDADSAMYHAKEAGRDRAVTFDLRTRRRIVERLETESLLRSALGRGELELHYQAQFAIADGRPVAAEGLLRWNHPTRGLVLPEAFIGVAEDCGLITEIGRWVLEEACRRLAEHPHLRLSVNVSPLQLHNGLVADVASALRSSGAAADRLRIELTESALLPDPVSARAALVALADLGVRTSLDDFGTGYSSLSHLQHLPIDELKIDRSFVARVDSPDGRAVVAAILAMADALGLSTVAEGVEQRSEADVLTALGCPTAQGFLFGRPVPFAALLATFDRHHHHTREAVAS